MQHSNFSYLSRYFISAFLLFGVWSAVLPGVHAEDMRQHSGKRVGEAFPASHAAHGDTHAHMGMIDASSEPWAQKLKGQTIVENAMERRANRSRW